jgi:ComF family protein
LLAVAETLGGLLEDAVPQNDLPDLLLPMPLHPQRLQERGFNQAAEIARHLGRRLAIPCDNNACRRIRPTPPQAGLSLRERLRNLRGAFDCSHDLSGRSVALVDDVMTTGASLNALAGAVKQAGAERVDCWVIARARRD